LTHAALLLASHAVDILWDLVLRVFLRVSKGFEARSTSNVSHSTYPLAVSASLDEHHGGLAVPALHRKVEGSHTRAVEGVETGLGASLRRAEEDVEERDAAGRRGAVEGMLARSVLCVDLV
jgi:hypothetical protein